MSDKIDLSEPFAEGRTAVIYPWKNGWMLKLFHSWVSEESVRYEARINRAVYAAGLAVPQVGEVIEVEDRLGLSYERLTGKTMGKVMAAKPWMLFHFARELAKLHATIHEVKAPADIPSQQKRLEHKIRSVETLETSIQKRLMLDLAEIAQHNQLCHGDFHPWNVMIEMGSQAKVIDWVDATSGAPLADVARTIIILEGVRHMTEIVTALEKVLVGWFHRIYLREYFKLRPANKNEYIRWLPIVAAGRMSEDIPGINPWLLNQVLKGMRT